MATRSLTEPFFKGFRLHAHSFVKHDVFTATENNLLILMDNKRYIGGLFIDPEVF